MHALPFFTSSSKLTQQGVKIRLEALAEMTLLIQATQTPSQDLGTRSLIYDTGPWKGENLLVGLVRPHNKWNAFLQRK